MTTKIDSLKNYQRKSAKEKRLKVHKINCNKVFLFNKYLDYNIWFNKSKVVASFLSIKSEISTIQLNKFILESGKTLCLPVIKKNNNEKLDFKKYNYDDKLLIGKFGIKEPQNDAICLPDLIFTPCLAYDELGFRLGYGGGYYDKTISYLKSINHKFIVVGFAYDEQKVESVFHDTYDQKLNYVLTEKKLYKIL